MDSSGSSVAGNVLFFFTDGFFGQAQSLFLAFEGAFFFTGWSDAASVGVGGGSGGIDSDGVSGGKGGISAAGPRLTKIFSNILRECHVVESSRAQ